MSKFVDLKKRSVALPPGCKDLIDVVERRKRQATTEVIEVAGVGLRLLHGCEVSATAASGKWKASESSSGAETAIGTLGDFEKLCGRMFEAPQTKGIMTANLADWRVKVALWKGGDNKLRVSVCVHGNERLSNAVRSFLERQKLLPPDATVDLSFAVIDFRISPIPPRAADLAEIAKNLFNELWGAVDQTQVYFYYKEEPSEA